MKPVASEEWAEFVNTGRPEIRYTVDTKFGRLEASGSGEWVLLFSEGVREFRNQELADIIRAKCRQLLDTPSDAPTA